MNHRASQTALPLTHALALLSGAAVLLLAFFMTIDVTSRRLGGPFSGISDTAASFVIVMVGTLPLAYALSMNAHVRIDVLKTFYPRRLNRLSDFFAFVSMLALASVLAWQAVGNAYESYRLGSHIPQAIVSLPLFIPQSIMALGYVLLSLQAARLVIAALLPARGGIAHA
ncbi:TRAP transporter small permease subunit [Halomonas sp. HK25]|uniref:TRAP transporter small permease subunit n=1 Tax=Halomonas sp. HK25 TaxID=3394321 RepID=UPI0039FB9048